MCLFIHHLCHPFIHSSIRSFFRSTFMVYFFYYYCCDVYFLPFLQLHISTTPSPTPRLFTYQSDFDENGVLFYLGTGGGTSAWKNPALTGAVIATSSGMMPDSAPEAALCGREVVRCVTAMRPDAWVQLEFKDHWLAPTHYTLRHYISWDTECLRNWVIEVSPPCLVLKKRKGEHLFCF